jgi:hypothetical protein
VRKAAGGNAVNASSIGKHCLRKEMLAVWEKEYMQLGTGSPQQYFSGCTIRVRESSQCEGGDIAKDSCGRFDG